MVLSVPIAVGGNLEKISKPLGPLHDFKYFDYLQEQGQKLTLSNASRIQLPACGAIRTTESPKKLQLCMTDPL